ncbi:MAG: glycosyltransferase family 2 protein [Acidobacteria bacterium]|nr:glycosyltransferase family 2 protein [Acidobacteriota bacterium]
MSEVFTFVPSYNHAPFIERCLKSIIKQTLSPKKLLVIDDGSKDDSPRIIEKVLKNCPFDAELIVRENRGLCATLNEGFAASAGEYFAYLGSDDVWFSNFLEERIKLLHGKPNAVLGYGNALYLNEHDEIFNSSVEWWTFPTDAREMLRLGIAPISSTVFYRRARLEKYRWNENSRLEDYEFYIKLCDEGEFVFDPQILSVWRHHGYNTSADIKLLMTEVLAAQKRNPEKLRLDETNFEEIQRAVRFRYADYSLYKGLKKDALKLALKNWRGASSIKQILRFSARMLLPMGVINLRRRFLREKMSGKYSVS